MNVRKDALSAAYRKLCEELSGVLYDEDPAGMGGTVGAPRDEYDGQAAKLASALRGARSRNDIVAYLDVTFGSYQPSLIDRVEVALAKFRMRSETARQVIGGAGTS